MAQTTRDNELSPVNTRSKRKHDLSSERETEKIAVVLSGMSSGWTAQGLVMTEPMLWRIQPQTNTLMRPAWTVMNVRLFVCGWGACLCTNGDYFWLTEDHVTRYLSSDRLTSGKGLCLGPMQCSSVCTASDGTSVFVHTICLRLWAGWPHESGQKDRRS